MQNSFCHPRGALYQPYGHPIGDLDVIVANNARLVSEARRRDVPVIFTRQRYRRAYVDIGRGAARHLNRLREVGGLASGTWDADVIDELSGSDRDIVVDKSRFDAFYGTDLDLLLRALGVSELIVTGVVTNACVESTVRSAATRDYGVTVVGDACGSRTPRHHEMSLECLQDFGFATIYTTTALFERLDYDVGKPS